LFECFLEVNVALLHVYSRSFTNRFRKKLVIFILLILLPFDKGSLEMYIKDLVNMCLNLYMYVLVLSVFILNVVRCHLVSDSDKA
jgi:uncharacterized protein YybS (DUF2232 family)